MRYDLFICHASEDKSTIARALAESLVAQDLAVWYDEYSLLIGDSIRQAIDRGLSESRFGVVILSPAFFAKRWTQYELDGIVNREMIAPTSVLLPVWHNVTADIVAAYSPSLAGRVGADTSNGVSAVVDEILKVVRPRASPLVVAREELVRRGVTPPTIANEFWLDVVEAANRVPATGAAVPDESTWGRWSFPLPGVDGTPEQRGFRLAWTAMQLAWTTDADHTPIELCTRPEEIWSFLNRNAGLLEVCKKFPELVAEYAPQATIRNFGGPLESLFDEAARMSPHDADSAELWCLRSPTFLGLSPSRVAYAYFSGGIFGPEVRLHEGADYLFWLLSQSSKWLPENIHQVLLLGMSQIKHVWLWHGWGSGDGEAWEHQGAFAEQLYAAEESARTNFSWTEKTRSDVRGRSQRAIERLGLDSTPDELTNRFIDAGVAAISLRFSAERMASGRARLVE
ncbi:toll/interleukin-1 receptor domain-containing protein [Gemmatimonas sp. UBA7669]|uniref:toll/interleukin-1 receptor domain-containing protein n=1 Tax=Gemmatimonas sp. UBA7669 TaxID=1946568 RepID=UPI0025BA8D5C|nr:toll/interleukin-1 receptor domain-containing protein [Gemmatimonas sp. UBA7669]